jgi:hypothetical protein
MNRLEQTEVCDQCGCPYLWAEGHNCPGPRFPRRPR